jgi:hypothetical protein
MTKHWIIQFEKNDYLDEIYVYEEQELQEKLEKMKNNEFITRIWVKKIEQIK